MAVLPDQNPAPGKLTAAQVAQWAASGGFGGVLTEAAGAASGSDPIVVATAVGLAESSGNPDTTHHNADGSIDYGVWQINDRAHEALFTQYPQWWSVTNANMAFAVWSAAGNSFSPWSSFKSGAYLVHMPAAQAARSQAGNPTGQGTVVTNNPLVNATNGLLGIAQKVFAAGSWLSSRQNWGRVALVGLGGAALVGALVIIARSPIEGAVGGISGVRGLLGSSGNDQPESEPESSADDKATESESKGEGS